MHFSIIYLTNRKDCRWQWFVDSLCRQVGADSWPEVIFVDSVLWGDAGQRKAELDSVVRGRFAYKHVSPKPCVWCGPHRLTQRDYFAAANSRNTGFCHASRDYVFWVDDLTVLMPDWLKEARHAAQHKYVIAGAYKKVWEMVVDDGELKSCRETAAGTDSRWGRGSERGIVKIGGGDLFGCSFGMPVPAMLAINGQDEACDSVGGEDYFAGLSLEKLGIEIFYDRNMLTFESEEGHGQGPIFLRLDKGLGKSSVDLLNKRKNSGPRAMGNFFDLAEMRTKVLSGEPFPIPTEPSKHFWDGQPLSEL